MQLSPFEWFRGPRSAFNLGDETGVYALFLREGVSLHGVEPGPHGLLYIGLAANRKGLRGRCHFDAQTRNHSPRKSLAALLMGTLGLNPYLITKPNSAKTWGLDSASDARLSQWMHDNLDLAVEYCANPDSRETELIGRYRPPLNLAKCIQDAGHRRISEARAEVMARLRGTPAFESSILGQRQNIAKRIPPSNKQDSNETRLRPPDRAAQPACSEFDSAEAIAARFGLNPKSYRQRLRDSISWYRKPQDWSFLKDSPEWNDMIAVARKMAG